MRLLCVMLVVGCGDKTRSDSGGGGATAPADTSTAPLPEPGTLELVATPSGTLVTRWELVVLAAEPLLPTVTCTAAEDREEHFVFAAAELTRRASFDVGGLLANTQYTCSATADGLVGSTRFTTEPLPDHLPQLVPSGAPGPSMASGYLVFNTWRFGVSNGQQLVVTDPQGRVRWYAAAPDASQVDVDVSFVGDGFLAAGGTTLPPTKWGLDGSVVWQSAFHEPIGWHHDVRLAGDGIVALTHRDNTYADVTFRGFGLELRRPWSDEVLWTWDSQQGVDAGTLPPVGGEGQDAWHPNAITWLPDDPSGPAYWVNLKYEDQIVRLEPGTGTLTERIGHGGDYTLIDPLGLGWFYGHHDPELTTDHLLVFDNGVGRPGDRYSRVVGYDVDMVARTLTATWEWTEPGWYDPLFGDADTLPDGHVLVDKGRCKDCNDPLGGDDRVWSIIELDPATQTVVYRLDSAVPDQSSYRADRIDGCALFANTRYCVP